MRILLISMPWLAVDIPPIGLGILSRIAKTNIEDVDVSLVAGNLEFVDWLHERCPLTAQDYGFFATDAHFDACGDWIFSTALHGDDRNTAEFERHMLRTYPRERLDLARRLRTLAPEFIREFADKVVATNPDVVGFTCTFQQSAAALATARRIKELAPDVRTVFGGANCDGPQGAALHRNFDYVDYVVRGEGEVVFQELVSMLRGDGDVTEISGLCWRRRDGASVSNAMRQRPLPPNTLVAPDYDEFFERWSASTVRSWHEPVLAVEGARGCWWGEKHHCTFCGLNGTSMEFRSKSPARFFDEIMDLVTRHRVLDLFVVDNILDMFYLSSVLPRLAEMDLDLRLHCEIKSNLRREQLRTLRDAGVVSIQPGIENLSTHVLKLMDKGATGCQNARILRDAESLGMAVSWNYLYGFADEAESDYTEVIDQLPALHHLTPPDGAGRIVLQRFSPNFDRPELGFPERRPALVQRLVFDLTEEECQDFAYIFETPPAGIGEDIADRLRAAIGTWSKAAAESRFTYRESGESIILVNTRNGFDWTVMTLTDPVECELFRLLDDPRRIATLATRLAQKFRKEVSTGYIAELLADWRARGIVFTDSDHFIQLATLSTNQHLVRTKTDIHRRAERHPHRELVER